MRKLLDLSLVLLVIAASMPLRSPVCAAEKQPQRISAVAKDLTALNESPAWRSFKARMGDKWAARWNLKTKTPHMVTGHATPLPGNPKITSDNVVPLSLSFIDRHSDLLKADGKKLRLVKTARVGGQWRVYFLQLHNGIPVIGGRVNLSYTADDRLYTFGSDVFPDIDVSTVPSVSSDAAVRVATADAGATGNDTVSAPELRILPIALNSKYNYLLCWRVAVTRPKAHVKWIYLIDASSGKIISKTNGLRSYTANGTVQGLYLPEFADDTPATGGFTNNEIVAKGPESVFQFWNMNANPLWPAEGEWIFGQPVGAGGSQHGYPDPASGYTGLNVFSINPDGDYSPTPGGPWYLTAGPINCISRNDVSLRFYQWLNIDGRPFAEASLEVSNNGTGWTTIWSNGTGPITESSWQPRTFDISSVAANKATVYIRWGYKLLPGFALYSGWNLDDVSLFYHSGGITNATTGQTGSYNITLPWNPSAISSKLSGPYCKISDGGGAPDPQFIQSGVTDGSVVNWIWDDILCNRIDESSVYWHVNHARDFFKQINPTFTGMDYPVPTTVYEPNLSDAYWDGYGMVFGAGDGVNWDNFGLYCDVIYHEYAHGVTDSIYTGFEDLGAWEFNAINEAISDYFACAMGPNPSPLVGDGGLQIGNENGYRNLNNTLRRETDRTGLPHVDGQMLGGSLWEARQLVGASVINKIAHEALYYHPLTFEDYLLAILLADDDISVGGDNDLTNGTPHSGGIYQAFGNHGIGGLRYMPETFVVDDSSGNEDGMLSPGETAYVYVTLINGWESASNIQGALSTTDPFVNITKATALFGDVGHGGITNIIGEPFEVTILPGCPETHTINFSLTVTASGFHPSYSRASLLHGLVGIRQIAYDDGQWDANIGLPPGDAIAVRFTPPIYPCYLTHVRLFPITEELLTVRFWDDDGIDGTPGTVLRDIGVNTPPASSWVDVDIGSEYLTITDGSIYVGWVSPEFSYANGFDLDVVPMETDPSPTFRFENATRQWSIVNYGNVMLRLRYTDSMLLQIEPPYEYTWDYLEPVQNCKATAVGGTRAENPPYYGPWEAAGLPDGVSIDPNTGDFSGAPIVYGTYQAMIQISDSAEPPSTAYQLFTINVVNCLPPPPSNPSPVDGACGVPLDVNLTWNYNRYSQDFELGAAPGWIENPGPDWEVEVDRYRASSGIVGRHLQSTFTGTTWVDCSAQAVVTLSSGGGAIAGVYLRAGSDFNIQSGVGSAYLLCIDRNKRYRIVRYVSGVGAVLQDWTVSAYINPGVGPNIITISVDGSALSGYVNGHRVWTGNDTLVSSSGRIGLYAYNSVVGAPYYFDDVAVGLPLQGDEGILPNNDQMAQYNVHFGSSPDSIYEVASDISYGPYSPVGLETGKTYYWKVVQKTPCGDVPGPIWEFTTVASVGQIKLLPDDQPVDIHGAIVSAVFPGCLYIVSDDRSCGIRVDKLNPGVALGDRADVVGTTNTNADGEKLIVAATVAKRGNGVAVPMAVNCRILGGSDFAYNPTTHTGQAGVNEWITTIPPNGFPRMIPGVNNIGQLVKLTGVVTASGREMFYIDDGSRIRDGSDFTGIYVEADGIFVPRKGDYIYVTGISSCQYFPHEGYVYLVSVLRPRSQSDIVVLKPGAIQGTGLLLAEVDDPIVDPRRPLR